MQNVPNNRADALAAGSPHYFTGKPCKYGHAAARNARWGICLECGRLKSNAAYRADPDSANAKAKLRYQANRGVRLAQVREYAARNKEAISLRNARYRLKNLELLRRKDRERYAERESATRKKYGREWRSRNAMRLSAYQVNYRRENPHRLAAIAAKRREAERRQRSSWYGEFDTFVLAEALRIARLRTRTTQAPWVVDHLVPLQSATASGLHCGLNVQVIPHILNARKANKLELCEPLEWLRLL